MQHNRLTTPNMNDSSSQGLLYHSLQIFATLVRHWSTSSQVKVGADGLKLSLLSKNVHPQTSQLIKVIRVAFRDVFHTAQRQTATAT